MNIGSMLHALVHAFSFHLRRRKRLYAHAVVVLVLLFGFFFFVAPAEFPVGKIITIKENTSFEETARMLEDEHILSSALLFKIVARIGQADRSIQAGEYVFSKPLGLSSVLYRMVNGISGIPTVRVTFPEGVTVIQIAQIVEEKLPHFDSAGFITLAAKDEGYLFPDTYDFPLAITPEEVRLRLRNRFDQVTKDLALTDQELGSIVTMASLLEKETKTPEERRIVSGILWKRLSLGMALQVDAVFGYIQGIDTYHPSGKDLDIDSPYNTYKYSGLPPGPIANPGEDSLKAALEPAATEYLYYLTGKDGVMYYARTFEEHKKNKELYLR